MVITHVVISIALGSLMQINFLVNFIVVIESYQNQSYPQEFMVIMTSVEFPLIQNQIHSIITLYFFLLVIFLHGLIEKIPHFMMNVKNVPQRLLNSSQVFLLMELMELNLVWFLIN